MAYRGFTGPEACSTALLKVAYVALPCILITLYHIIKYIPKWLSISPVGINMLLRVLPCKSILALACIIEEPETPNKTEMYLIIEYHIETH